MKKFTALLLAAIILFGSVLCIKPELIFAKAESAEYTNGYYTYTVDENGNATITGFDTSIRGNIEIPSTIDGYAVTAIGDYVFANCTAITDITIPDCITKIGRDAFYKSGIYNDETNWENDILYIGNYLIDSNFGYGSFGGDNYSIKEGTRVIAPWAFKNSYLTEIEIPQSVITIGENAFDNSVHLKNIIFHDGLISIEKEAFSGCYALETIKIPGTVKTIGIGAFEGCSALSVVTLNEGLEKIGINAFGGCISLTEIVIPDSVTVIGEGAFGGSYSDLEEEPSGGTLYSEKSPLETVVMGSGLTYIPQTLINQETLKSFTVGESVSRITEYDFMGCKLLETLIFNATDCDYIIYDGYYESWSNCDKLTSITIGNNVKTIPQHMFSVSPIRDVYYKGTQKEWNAVNIEPGNDSILNATIHYCFDYLNYTVDENGNATITGCDENLCGDILVPSTIDDYSVTAIGDGAFYECKAIESVTIPEGITNIGVAAFYGTANLKSITVDDANPSYVSDEYGVLFNKDKTELIQYPAGSTNKSYVIPESVTEIVAFAFCGSNNLTSVTIFGDVENIADYTFSYCPNLTGITLSKKVIDIGDHAFYNSPELADVYYEGTEEEWRAITIGIENEPLTNAEIHFNCEIEKPTIQPETPTDIPEEPSVNPEEPSTNPEELTTKLTEPSTTKPAENPTTSPEESTTKPVETDPSMTKPVEEPTAEPTATIPAEPTTKPAVTEPSTTKPVEEPSTSPEVPTTKPEEPTTKPSAPDEPEVDEEVIPQPQVGEIKYGDAMILYVDSSKIPEGGRVEWSANNSCFSYFVDSDFSCTINPESSGDTTFTATIYDADGNIVSTDEQILTSKAGFFQKIIGFFKKLFNLTKVHTNI